MQKRIVIIGAGPTGLGAAYRLQELGYKNWVIYEANNYVGGLSTSFKDKEGFTWDIGGHVIHSHYKYFDNVFEKLMKKQYSEHMRESWIRTIDSWVPYPFQNNIKYLPKDKVLNCLYGLLKITKQPPISKNFKEWLCSIFGSELAAIFFIPDNQKRWCYPLEKIGLSWINDRVSVVDIKKILRNIIMDIDDIGWGPNSKFKYPLRGGTGDFFNRFTPFIQGKMYLNKKLVEIDLESKKLRFADKSLDNYDFLISTIPIGVLTESFGRKSLQKKAGLLRHNSALISGIGIRQSCPSKKCWIYSPQKDVSFFRTTYLSNYSPNNTPINGSYSLMCETNYIKKEKENNKEKVIAKTIDDLIKLQIINRKDKKDIISRYLIDVKYAYPIPTLNRDKTLREIQPYLEKNAIYSRGRFGAWKYEIGNMDHCLMQGVEIIDRLVLGKPERVWSL